MTGGRTERAALPRDAGIHSRQLDLQQTREEVAVTLDDLFATFNPGVQIRSHPVLFAGLFLAAVGAVVAAVVRFNAGRAPASGRSRGR
ncbi:hypothetical protein [Leifsonia poae]|uniref:hypothetical protein n=1 Tax=Leifsonia poae TaxID=110933 RepID=UPI001CBE2333|nr:hypothetical protein [Leifsonia poae]